MAFKGHNRQGYCVITETEAADGTISEALGNGVLTSHVVSFKGSQKQDSVELYGGDTLEEEDFGAYSGDITIDRTQLSLEDEGALCGHTYTQEAGLTCTSTDRAPYVRYAAIGVGTKNGKDFFRLVMYYRVRFSNPDDDLETKKSSVAYKTHALTGKATENCEGKTVDKRDFDKFAEALEAMRTFLHVVPAKEVTP